MNWILFQVPIVVGVCLNTYADVKFSLLGTVYALVAVAVTSVYQVVSEREQLYCWGSKKGL